MVCREGGGWEVEKEGERKSINQDSSRTTISLPDCSAILLSSSTTPTSLFVARRSPSQLERFLHRQPVILLSQNRDFATFNLSFLSGAPLGPALSQRRQLYYPFVEATLWAMETVGRVEVRRKGARAGGERRG